VYGKSTQILLVDDEPRLYAALCDELSRLGVDCCMAAGLQQADHVLDNRQVDVLLVDFRRRATSDLDVLTFAVRHAPTCGIVLATGHTSPEYLAKVVALGAYHYVESPFDPRMLSSLVLRVVGTGTVTRERPGPALAMLEHAAQAPPGSVESVRALVRAVEAKDPFTRRHSEQVAHYAVHMAMFLNMPAMIIEHIRLASLLHDIGKIGVPDCILTKPSGLTDDEFEFVRRHPALGAEIVADITSLREESLLVRHHHERWDGTGYPDGLTGEETPLASRIMCVADCMDAMLMARTYKMGYPVEKMLGELERGAATQFDPRIAAAAVEWCRANPAEVILPTPLAQKSPGTRVRDLPIAR
jgi:response regulator RpfG family c-di-GMP phosphodiesterase